MDDEGSSSWCSSCTVKVPERQSGVTSLSYSQIQFPENLSFETLREHLVSRNVLGADEKVEKEALISLFRKHILPLPKREGNNEVKRLNAGVRAVNITKNKTERKKRKMIESDVESIESAPNQDDARVGGTSHNDLTVRIPDHRNESSKPVKLKRKNYDKIQKQNQEKNARLDEKEPVIPHAMSEISPDSSQQPAAAILAQESLKPNEEKLKNRVSPPKISYAAETSSGKKVTKHFHESKRKVRLPSVRAEYSETCAVEVDESIGEVKQQVHVIDEKDKSQPQKSVEKEIEVIEVDKGCEINSNDNISEYASAETLQISFRSGSMRSTVLVAKAAEEKPQNNPAEEKMQQKEQLSSRDKHDLSSSRISGGRSNPQSSKKEQGDRERKTSNRGRNSPSSSRRASESNSRSTHERLDVRKDTRKSRRTPPHPNLRRSRSPAARFTRGSERRPWRGERQINRGGRSTFDRSFRRRTVEYNNRNARNRSRSRERLNEKAKRRSSSRELRRRSSDDKGHEKTKRSHDDESELSKKERDKMKKELKEVEMMIEIKSKKKNKEKNRENECVEVSGEAGKVDKVDIETSTINVAIHSYDNTPEPAPERYLQSIDERKIGEVKDRKSSHSEPKTEEAASPEEKVDTEATVKGKVNDTNVVVVTTENFQTSIKPVANKEDNTEIMVQESSNGASENKSEDSSTKNKKHKQKKDKQSDDSGGTSENTQKSGVGKDGASTVSKEEVSSDSGSGKSSSEGDSQSDDSDHSSDKDSDSTDNSEQGRSKKKKKSKKRKKKNKSDLESDLSDSDDSEDSLKKRKKRKKKRKKKKKKRRKKKKDLTTTLMDQEQLKAWLEKEKEKMREDIMRELQQQQQQLQQKVSKPPGEMSKSEIAKTTEKNEVQKATGSKKKTKVEEVQAECLDAEVCESTDEEMLLMHGFPTGIPLSKDKEELMEVNEPDGEKVKKDEEEIFDLFKSDEDLDYDLKEEGNWKRKAKDEDGAKSDSKMKKSKTYDGSKGHSHGEREDKHRHRRRDRDRNHRTSRSNSNSVNGDKKSPLISTHQRSAKKEIKTESNSSSYRNETRKEQVEEDKSREEKNVSRNRQERRSERRGDQHQHQKPDIPVKQERQEIKTPVLKESKGKEGHSDSGRYEKSRCPSIPNVQIPVQLEKQPPSHASATTPVDGMAIANKVRDDVFKSNDFWKGTTGQQKRTPNPHVNVFSKNDSTLEREDDPHKQDNASNRITGHWVTPSLSNIQSRLKSIANLEDLGKAKTPCISRLDSSSEKNKFVGGRGVTDDGFDTGRYHKSTNSTRDNESDKRNKEIAAKLEKSSQHPRSEYRQSSRNSVTDRHSNGRDASDAKQRRDSIGRRRTSTEKRPDSIERRRESSDRLRREDERFRKDNKSKEAVRSTSTRARNSTNDNRDTLDSRSYRRSEKTSSSTYRYGNSSGDRRHASDADLGKSINDSKKTDLRDIVTKSNHDKVFQPAVQSMQGESSDSDNRNENSSTSAVTNFTRPEKNYRGSKRR
ncbi:dentin sialophosphoprotein-like [Hydractinia symbiolongicarpus]|uniref:dentin sialophosphoprotein-like n=1 Tax=Hydractinia symbiolongicarpus TaxID=13093 RepID=UPI002551B039|nr:dentin sialophosphoprotein-like [Hydractinia symbiolongicarpus]